VGSFAYRCLKKFAYGGIANFFILSICFAVHSILSLEIASGVGLFVWLELLGGGIF
jgi:hypothetical protein